MVSIACIFLVMSLSELMISRLRFSSSGVCGGGNILTIASRLRSKVTAGSVIPGTTDSGRVVTSPPAFFLSIATSIALIFLVMSLSELMISHLRFSSSGVCGGGNTLTIATTLGSRVAVVELIVDREADDE